MPCPGASANAQYRVHGLYKECVGGGKAVRSGDAKAVRSADDTDLQPAHARVSLKGSRDRCLDAARSPSAKVCGCTIVAHKHKRMLSYEQISNVTHHLAIQYGGRSLRPMLLLRGSHGCVSASVAGPSGVQHHRHSARPVVFS